MGSTTYSRLKEMLEKYRGEELTLDALRKLLMIHIGSDERTIQTGLKTMGETGLIKDIDNSSFEVVG